MRNKENLLQKQQQLFTKLIAMNATLIISGKQKTKQVRDRINEHQNNIRIGEQNSMIFQHVANNNHNMDFSNPTVLAKNQHPVEDVF